jgi:hypothetical protein
MAYRQRGHTDLHPADARLNLPVEKHSHGLRRLAALEAARGSFDDAVAAIERACAVRIGKRQVAGLAAAAAVDVDAFYAAHAPEPALDADVLVMTYDAKGVVMRPDALRAATARSAASQKLVTRLSKGEKRNRKRMAEIAAVYDLTPAPRTGADIMPDDEQPDPAPPPKAAGKWLCASVTDNAATVIAARTRKVNVSVVVDFIHVLEYVWKAAWCFHAEGDPKAEQWVRDQARQILAGRAGIVAAAIRRKATYHGLDPGQRNEVVHD